MLIRVTRGWGGRKGLLILVLTGIVGALLLGGAGWARRRLSGVTGVIATALPPDQVLALGTNARGTMPELAFVPNDLARVTGFAAGQGQDGIWVGVPDGTVLQVTAVRITDGQTWVTGTAPANGLHNEPVTMHASFLSRYQPVVLEGALEISDVRLVRTTTDSGNQTAVTGWLRNVSPAVLSNCIVHCIFQDHDEREVDDQPAAAQDLHPLELVRFQCAATDKSFSAIAIQITNRTPDGWPHSFSAVVINKSSL